MLPEYKSEGIIFRVSYLKCEIPSTSLSLAKLRPRYHSAIAFLAANAHGMLYCCVATGCGRANRITQEIV